MTIRFDALDILIMAAMAAYLGACVALGLRRRLVGHGLFALGFAVAVAAFVLRWVRVQHLPMQNLFEVFLSMGMMMYPITLFCRRFVKVGGEAADAFIGLVVLLPAAFVFDPEPQKLPPALQSPLFAPHVATYLLAYVIMAKATVQAFLTASRKTRLAILALTVPRMALPTYWYVAAKYAPPVARNAWGEILGWWIVPVGTALDDVHARFLGGEGLALVPAGVLVDALLAALAIYLLVKAKALPVETQALHEAGAYRIVALGFPALTLGLVLGAWWGKVAWGDYWQWDPKELWSLVSWLVFLFYLHVRRLFGPRNVRLNAALVIGGMAAILITLLWANLASIFAGLHSYAA